MKYPLASDTWGNEEIDALHRVIDSGRYTMGPEVAKFEEEFATYIGSRNAVMVNSGSSANLITLAAMLYHPDYDLNPGDVVLVPAVSWSTTYFPIWQLGLRPKLLDVDVNTFNIDVDQVENAISSETRAIFAVNLLGAPADLLALKGICRKHRLILIEDNCESLGATAHSVERPNRYAGTFGSAGTFSFFFSHHLQTMEGGMIVTDDDNLADYMRSLRAHGWTRDWKTIPEIAPKTGDAFDDSYTFVLPGYCVRPLEMSAAVGRVQLRKIPKMLEYRRKNAILLENLIGQHPKLRLQRASLRHSSWFGFGFCLHYDWANKRKSLVRHLTNLGIETRPIVAGNFARQPVVKMMRMGGRMIIPPNLPNADWIHDSGFFVGNDSRDLTPEIDHFVAAIKRFSHA